MFKKIHQKNLKIASSSVKNTSHWQLPCAKGPTNFRVDIILLGDTFRYLNVMEPRNPVIFWVVYVILIVRNHQNQSKSKSIVVTVPNLVLSS